MLAFAQSRVSTTTAWTAPRRAPASRRARGLRELISVGAVESVSTEDLELKPDRKYKPYLRSIRSPSHPITVMKPDKTIQSGPRSHEPSLKKEEEKQRFFNHCHYSCIKGKMPLKPLSPPRKSEKVCVDPYSSRLGYTFQLASCTASLLPELKPAPCFLSAIIGQID